MTVAMCFLVRCSAEVNKARLWYVRVYACCHGSQSVPVEKSFNPLPPLPKFDHYEEPIIGVPDSAGF